jgi:hypothetical protein
MHMKRFVLTTLAVVCSVVVWAQSPVKQSVKVPVEQLPVAIRQAYEKDFGSVPEEGWSAFVVTSKEGKRTTAKPMYYAYSRREGKKKIEIRFTPEGEITSVKGVTAPNGEVTDQGTLRTDG